MGLIVALTIYFLMTFIAYFTGSCVFAYAAYKDHRPMFAIAKVLLLIVVCSILGSKIFHVLFEAPGHIAPDGTLIRSLWELMQADPWHAFRLNDPGYVFYGGLVGALFVALAYPGYVNYTAKALALGLSIGRLGCFWTGCCYGLAEIPVQLMESGFMLWLFFKIDRLDDLLIRYSLWRFGVEFLRADESRGIWALGLSTSQWISLGILGVLAGRALTSAFKSSQMPQTRIQT
ncbi:MAG: prolipoprotein diacylglyceryl transferase family protein [Myxococcota bacterium]